MVIEIARFPQNQVGGLTMEEHSKYQYPVVIDKSGQNSPMSFQNIEDMLFEVNI